MLQGNFKEQLHSQEIRRKIEYGIIPANICIKRIVQALWLTRKPNVFELFGFLSAIKKSFGMPDIDYGLVSVKLVTTAFFL